MPIDRPPVFRDFGSTGFVSVTERRL